jgi:flagellar protein FlbT
MTGLVLKLRPFEKLLVNGAVLENGARSTRLRVRTPGACVLRLRDALHPCDAASLAGRIYFIAQLVVAGEADAAHVNEQLVVLIDEAVATAPDDNERSLFKRAHEAAASGRFFTVMRAVKPLLAKSGDPAPIS